MNSSSRTVDALALNLELPELHTRRDGMYPPIRYRRPWNRDELLSLLPNEGARVLDVGAGRSPIRVRPQDKLVTVDFEGDAEASVTADVAASWPFGDQEFDLVYMSHVLEHFYPADRDAVVRRVYSSLRPGGILFIRVPHKSSFLSTGWEHFSVYGLSGVSGLCHGHNPMLPMFRAVSVGVSLSLDFEIPRTRARAVLETALSRYWRLTDTLLCHLVNGIPEVQFMLQRMDSDTERRLRDGPSAYG
ncbi:MAG: methyltransferase domain-containing protein [Solirubrobacteraceae bacterium]